MPEWDKAKRFLKLFPQMISEYIRDDGFFLAAGIAWYGLLSLFPMLLIGVALLGYLLPPDQPAGKHTLEMAALYLPPNVVTYVRQNLNTLYEDSGKVGIAGILVLLWSGRHLFRALELALHRAWQIPLTRTYFTGNLLSMLLVLLCAAVTFLVGLFSGFLSWVEVVLSHVRLPHVAGISLDQALFWNWVHGWVVTPIAILLIFLLLYTLLPCRQVPLIAAVPGAVFATSLWKLTGWIYVTYVVRLMFLNPIYASIGSLAGMMLWLYVSAVVFLLGAELVYCVLQEYFPPDAPAAAKKAKKKK